MLSCFCLHFKASNLQHCQHNTVHTSGVMKVRHAISTINNAFHHVSQHIIHTHTILIAQKQNEKIAQNDELKSVARLDSFMPQTGTTDYILTETAQLAFICRPFCFI